MQIYSDFQDGGNFNSKSAVRGKCESPCQISSKSVKQLQRYGDLTVSKLLFHLSLTDQHHPYTGIDTDRGAEKCLEEAEKAFQNSDAPKTCREYCHAKQPEHKLSLSTNCWWGAGVVICLERGADLHMALLMPLPLIVSCFSKIQIGFTFLVPAHSGSPGQRAVRWVCGKERMSANQHQYTTCCIRLSEAGLTHMHDSMH